ncbi:MAG TPA: hypothetical protein VF635_07335, partial [Propionibacteriaceae bacterium]
MCMARSTHGRCPCSSGYRSVNGKSHRPGRAAQPRCRGRGCGGQGIRFLLDEGEVGAGDGEELAVAECFAPEAGGAFQVVAVEHHDQGPVRAGLVLT